MGVESASQRAAGHPELDEAVGRRAHAGDWPGGVYAIGPPASSPRYLGAVGARALVPDAEPAHADDLYDLASLTKPLATAAVGLRLAASGRLDPDRPLLELLPEFTDHAGAAPSLHSLLTHTSGLPAWVPLYRRAARPEEVPAVLAELAPRGPALAEPVYSCIGAIAAGVALERATGSSLNELLKSEVTAPIGLEADALSFGPVSAVRAAPTEQGRRREAQMAGEGDLGSEIVPASGCVLRGEVHDGNARFLGGQAGNAGLFGTAMAVFRLVSALAGAGSFLPSSLRSRLSDPSARSAREVRTFGFQHGDSPDAPVPRELAGSEGAFGHVGFTGTSAWVFPRRDAVVVLLTNRVHPVWRDVPMQAWRREFHATALRVLTEESW